MLSRSAGGLALFLLIQSPLSAEPLVPDTPTGVSDIEVVCTGTSLDAREDPRWNAYSLKIEFAGSGGHYLGGESVTLRRGDAVLFSGSCNGPWLLFRLPPGRYAVEANLDGQTVNSRAIVSAAGQARLVLRFAEAV